MFLNHVDIANLDFRKKIYINNNIYKLSKILDWTTTGSVKVELLQEAALSDTAFINNDVYLLNTSRTGGGTGVGVGGLGAGTGTYLTNGLITTTRNVINLMPPSTNRSIPFTGVTHEGDFGTYYLPNTHNYFPPQARGIVVGQGNLIQNSNFFIQGSNNVVSSDNTMLLNSKNINVNSGVTNTTLIGTSGLTVTTSDQVYVKNVEFTSDSNMVMPPDKAIYFGDPNTNGTWRLRIDSTNKMIYENRAAGVYVVKGSYSPA